MAKFSVDLVRDFSGEILEEFSEELLEKLLDDLLEDLRNWVLEFLGIVHKEAFLIDLDMKKCGMDLE